MNRGGDVDDALRSDAPPSPATCLLCGRPETDEMHEGPADTDGLHLFEEYHE